MPMLLPKKYLLEWNFFGLPKLSCSSVVGSRNLDVWAVIVLKEEVESMELSMWRSSHISCSFI